MPLNEQEPGYLSRDENQHRKQEKNIPDSRYGIDEVTVKRHDNQGFNGHQDGGSNHSGNEKYPGGKNQLATAVHHDFLEEIPDIWLIRIHGQKLPDDAE